MDGDAAAIVRRIFAVCAGGSGPSQIARILKKEQILTPTMYAYTRYSITHTCLDTAHPYNWSDSAIANLLENEIYLGNTINMKHSSRSYKDKRRIEHPREECLVFENTHPAIITREVWDVVQRVRKNTRPRPWRLTTTALAMSAADSRMWKKHWKHRKPRTQLIPGRHRKHDDLPGYPRNHLLPL